MGAGRGQLDYGRVIAGEHVTHADARVPFASSHYSQSTPPTFVLCVTRDAGLLLTGLSSHIYFYSRSHKEGCRSAASRVAHAAKQHGQEVREEAAARRREARIWAAVEVCEAAGSC